MFKVGDRVRIDFAQINSIYDSLSEDEKEKIDLLDKNKIYIINYIYKGYTYPYDLKDVKGLCFAENELILHNNNSKRIN